MTNKEKSSNNKNNIEMEKKAVQPEVILPEESDNQNISLAMDGTAHSVISIMQNVNYSKEIIQKSLDVYNFDKLKVLKGEGEVSFLKEGKNQIITLWQSIEALSTHSTMFVVLFLIAIGEILNEIKSYLKPHKYAKWRKNNFEIKHERYLQQAQQLARIAPFAKKYASLGKKRLLDLDHLRKIQKLESFQDIFNKHPLQDNNSLEITSSDKSSEQSTFPDTTEDLDGDLLKGYVDGIISYQRLKKTEIEFVTFDQAMLIAEFEKEAITIKKAKKIKAWLDTKHGEEEQKKQFDFLLINKMTFPENRTSSPHAQDSFNKCLAEFVQLCEKSNLENDEWIEGQKKILDENIFFKAYNFIHALKDKFGINPSTGIETTINTNI